MHRRSRIFQAVAAFLAVTGLLSGCGEGGQTSTTSASPPADAPTTTTAPIIPGAPASDPPLESSAAEGKPNPLGSANFTFKKFPLRVTLGGFFEDPTQFVATPDGSKQLVADPGEVFLTVDAQFQNLQADRPTAFPLFDVITEFALYVPRADVAALDFGANLNCDTPFLPETGLYTPQTYCRLRTYPSQLFKTNPLSAQIGQSLLFSVQDPVPAGTIAKLHTDDWVFRATNSIGEVFNPA